MGLARHLLSLSGPSNCVLRRWPELRQPWLAPGGAPPTTTTALKRRPLPSWGQWLLTGKTFTIPALNILRKRSECLIPREKIRVISWGQKGTIWHQSCHAAEWQNATVHPTHPMGPASSFKSSSRWKQPLIQGKHPNTNETQPKFGFFTTTVLIRVYSLTKG